jgi:RNA polymerase sigma factor (sigma-70 family)
VGRYLSLIERHQDLIFWRCYRHARYRRQQAFDYQQEVRLRIYVSLGTLRPDANEHEERAWVKLQIRSVLSNLRCVEHSDLPLEAADQVPDSDEQRENRELLDDLLAYLADDDRQLLQWTLDGYSGAEIADRLGIDINTAYKRISRAKQRMVGVYKRLYN